MDFGKNGFEIIMPDSAHISRLSGGLKVMLIKSAFGLPYAPKRGDVVKNKKKRCDMRRKKRGR